MRSLLSTFLTRWIHLWPAPPPAISFASLCDTGGPPRISVRREHAAKICLGQVTAHQASSRRSFAMPRDFAAEKDVLKGMPPLEKSSGSLTDMTDMNAQNSQLDDLKNRLHPFTQILTMKDLESCVKLEQATFPPHQRCSREKVSDRFPYTEMACGFPLVHPILTPRSWKLEIRPIAFGKTTSKCWHPFVSWTLVPAPSSWAASLTSAVDASEAFPEYL